MSESRSQPRGDRRLAGEREEEVRYPTDHVVGIVDTREQLEGALDALTGGGFLESEIRVAHGPAAAARLEATTGRTGLVDRLLRFAERIGMPNDETAIKDRYEQALRDGQFVALVLAPSDERKARAADVLRSKGGHFINYFGRSSIERIAR
jgi:hypothetical protein